MAHKLSTPLPIPLSRFTAVSAALLSTLLLMACSDGPQSTLPLAPSALPAFGLLLEADGEIDAWGTLGRGSEKAADDEDSDSEEDSDHDSEEGNPHHGAGPHRGAVSRFRGVCPAVTFNLKGLAIVADAATTYTGGTCATLRPNVQVLVTGGLLPQRRMFKAATIAITQTH